MVETPLQRVLRLSGKIDPKYIALFNPNHDDHGRFGVGSNAPTQSAGGHGPGAARGNVDATKAAKIAENNPEGFTVNPGNLSMVKSGYVVALDNKLSQRVSDEEWKANKVAIAREYLGKVRDAAKTNSQVKLGGWHSTADKQFVLDHVEVYPNSAKGKSAALAAGVARDQQAIFHIDTMTEIPTGGTGGKSGKSP